MLNDLGPRLMKLNELKQVDQELNSKNNELTNLKREISKLKESKFK